MQVACDLCQLNGTLRIAQRLQDISCLFCHQRNMGKAMLGKAQRRQCGICLPDIGIDGFVVPDLFVSQVITPLFLEILR